MTELERYDFEGETVRVTLIDGEPWFILGDLCRVLGLENSRNVTDRLRRQGLEAAVRTTDIRSGGQTRAVTIVAEPGMYAVIFQSRKPLALRFQHWVYTVLLPAYRRGKLQPVQQQPAVPQDYRSALLELVAAIDAKDAAEQQAAAAVAELEEAAPKVEMADTFLAASGDYSVADAAAMLSRQSGLVIGQNALFERMHQFGMVCRGDRRRWRAMARATRAGWLTEKPAPYIDEATGETLLSYTVRVMPRGLEHLRRKLAGL